MGVKTPPLSSRMRGPIFPPLPQVPFRAEPRNLPTPHSTPLHPITVRHSHRPPHSSSPTWPSPVGALLPLPSPLRGERLGWGENSPLVLAQAGTHLSSSPPSAIPSGASESHRPHFQHPFIPLLCAIPTAHRTTLPPHGRPPWAPLRGKVRMGVKTPPLSSRMRGPIPLAHGPVSL